MARNKNQKVKLNSLIYPRVAVQKAISEYSSFATIYLKKKGKYTQIEIKEAHPQFQHILKDEFCNYLLSLIKK